jgi:hypothetical protein
MYEPPPKRSIAQLNLPPIAELNVMHNYGAMVNSAVLL